MHHDRDGFIAAVWAATTGALRRPGFRFTGTELARSYRGVYLNLNVRAREVELFELNVPHRLRGRFKGTTAMHWLVDTARQFGFKVITVAEPFDGCPLTQPALATWYRRMGVVVKNKFAWE